MSEPSEMPAQSVVPSAAACAEAAAWIARLHGEGRTAKVEAGFKRWLAANRDHQAAFEMANDIWNRTEQLPKPATPAYVRWPRKGLVVTWQRALAAGATLIVIIGITAALVFGQSRLVTLVGEQRNWSLEDGTRISLNTASRIRVHYDHVVRHVYLDQGEAFFQVAKHPNWPFIVTAGGKQVVAVGTAFVVRRDEERVAVTLVEGKVTVSEAGQVPDGTAGRSSGAASRSATEAHKADRPALTLTAGQRLTFIAHELPKVDRPSLERVTAWQRGQVILDHTPLVDAVAEMNRYSGKSLRIEAREAEHAQVTGIFRIGDSENFAQAVAETYRLKVEDRGDEIVIVKASEN